MRQIVQDWCYYYEDKIDCQRGQFFTLFMENVSKDEINEIYKYFPFNVQLVDRMEKYIYSHHSSIEPIEHLKDELRNLIMKDFDDRIATLRQIDSFNNFLINPEFIYTTESNILDHLQFEDIWSVHFFDHTYSLRKISGWKIYEIYNALYGLTNDFDYQLYLFIPFLNIDYTGDHLFNFKKLGGIYAISDNKVYYSFKN